MIDLETIKRIKWYDKRMIMFLKSAIVIEYKGTATKTLFPFLVTLVYVIDNWLMNFLF